MIWYRFRPARSVILGLFMALGAGICIAGVSRAIQDRYKANYENKAFFLKIPTFSEKQYIFITGSSIRPEQALGPARFKVGDQVRILSLDFGGDEIRFKLSAIKGAAAGELVFKFDASLQDAFPNSDVFDQALASTFTEGLKFTEIEEAKSGFVGEEFERMVRDLAATTNTNRDFVVRSVAPRIQAYQDALRDVENLKSQNMDLANQVNRLQGENRKIDSDSRQQQAELSRLRSQVSSLQAKIDSSTSQLNRLGDDLRTARGMNQDYQTQINTLQRSLNLKVDSNRDLTSQINDLGQGLKRLQGEKEGLETEVASLRGSLDKERSTNQSLSRENDDQKVLIQQQQNTIATLSSKEDSLARQYLQLKQVKENLENAALAAENLRSLTVEERVEGSVEILKSELYLRDLLLGTIVSRLPVRISLNEQQPGEVVFNTESIDYVRVAPEERQILRSLGERLRMGARLAASEDTVSIQAEKDSVVQEIGERDQAAWKWRIMNRGTSDARLRLNVYLVTRNGEEIPILASDRSLLAGSVVRQAREYLQPIPLAVGAVLGFLLFGIAGIFRRGRRVDPARKREGSAASEHSAYTGQKQL